MKATDRSLLISYNPATLEQVGAVPITTPEEVEQIVAQAAAAFPQWRDLGLVKRAGILKKSQQLLLERTDLLARLIAMEMGRPMVEAMVTEVEATVDLMGYYVKHGNKLLSERKLSLGHPFFKRRTSRFYYLPLGVLGVIAPWNWPLLIPMGCIVPALLCGNAVVFKHSELTPLVAEEIRKLFVDAGVPAAVMQIVQGRGEVGNALVNSSVAKIFFTGSTAVGKKIMVQTAQNLKEAVLELGGSDPAIICADADINIAASGVTWGAFNNCGQNCNSIERVFVHEDIAGKFIPLVVEKVKTLRVGNGLADNVDIGPLASAAQLEKIKAIVAMEVQQGAKILLGGNPISSLGKGFFFEPTIILRHKNQSSPRDMEVFGPILFITETASDDEAIVLANDSAFGLAASVWTANKKKGIKIAKQVQAGSVMINDAIVSFGIPEAHWTGVKDSGIGWVHGERGLDEMVTIQYLNYNPQYHGQNFWWFPYSQKMGVAIKGAMNLLFSSGLGKRLAALPTVLKHFTSYLLRNSSHHDKL